MINIRTLLTRRSVLNALRFGTEVAGKIPTGKDSWVEIVAKMLAIGDAAEKTFGRRSSPHDDLFSRYTLKERSSESFVRLFFGTRLASLHRIERHHGGEHLDILEAIAPDGERCFFMEQRYGRPEVADGFFHTLGFDFAAATDAVWEAYPNGLYLSTQPHPRGWGMEVT